MQNKPAIYNYRVHSLRNCIIAHLLAVWAAIDIHQSRVARGGVKVRWEEDSTIQSRPYSANRPFHVCTIKYVSYQQ